MEKCVTIKEVGPKQNVVLVMKHFRKVHMEEFLEFLENTILRCIENNENSICIVTINFKDSLSSEIDIPSIKTVVSFFLNKFSKHIKKIYMINSPFWIRTLYTLAYVFLPQKTKRKLEFI